MLLIDIEALQNKNYKDRGIGRYIRNLLTSLRQHGVVFKGVFNPHLPPPAINRAWLEHGMIPATRAAMKHNPADWLITLSPIEESLGNTPIIYRNVNKNGRVATLIYDLIPIIYEDTYLRNKIDRSIYDICTASYIKSDLILTISNNTKNDVEKIISPSCPIVSIGTGVDDIFYDQKNHDDHLRFREHVIKWGNVEPLRYIFTVSGLHKSKNLHFLMEAYSKLDYDFRYMHPLVIAGGFSPQAAQDIYSSWNRLFLNCEYNKTEICVEGHLSDDIIREYYRNTALFIYPSLYEGFGLPLAEAIVSGVPCIASPRSAMREIMPLEAAHFDPRDINSLKNKIQSTLHDRMYRANFLEWSSAEKDRFRWQHVASKLINSISQFDNIRIEYNNINTDAKNAIVGPLKPARTGIATYNSIMIDYLTPNFDWFSTEGFSKFPIGAKPFPAKMIEKSWVNYDNILYVIGNSFHHLFSLESLMKRPGIVWLHDVRLNGLAWDYANKLSPNNPFEIINSWIREYNVGYNRIESLSDLLNAPFSFARPLLKMARSFIVHSEHAKAMLIEDLGECAEGIAINVIPLAIEAYPYKKKIEHLNRKIVNIGVVGFIDPIKQPELIIRASGLLAKEGYDVTVSLLGNIDSSYAAKLLAVGESVNIKVSSYGYLDDDEFKELITMLDVVVLVRRTTNGESSATAGEIIAAGIPIISNIPSVVEHYSDYVNVVSPLVNQFELCIEMKKIFSTENQQRLNELSNKIIEKNSFSFVSKRIMEIVR